MNNKRPCRYGAACRNPTCSFSHEVSSIIQPQSYGSSSSQPCRYGASCKRQDCRFSHQSAPTNPSYPSVHSSSSPSMTPCRFGISCTASNCRFYHDDDEEFSPEEEERIDEILDMIEQEQRAREGGEDDEEDDKNIDEIFAFMQKQQASNPQNGVEDFSLPEGADDEYEAMIQQQQHGGYNYNAYQQDGLVSEMNNLSVKGMSATSAPFVPGNVANH